MRDLTVLSSTDDDGLRRQLAGRFAVRWLALEDVARHEPNSLILVDIDLDRTAYADHLRRWLRRRPEQAMTIFAVDKRSRVQTVQAYSIGATDIVYRPVSSGTLIGKLSPARPESGRPDAGAPESSCGVVAGIAALQQLFSTATRGTPLRAEVIERAGETLVDHIEAYGFGDWVRAIRIHHDQTYQHCLLVAGATAAFARHVGFRGADRSRVAIAGLLHDTGKVKVPARILEAPRKLAGSETRLVQRHPAFGFEALKTAEGLRPEMLDVVLHHHEYLDGTGYPEGLGGGEISDLTRVVTIADIFAALIERRAYRPPMSGGAAFDVLLEMGGKLDQHLVRAFRPLSEVAFDGA